MKERFSTARLSGIAPAEFRAEIERLLSVRDSAMEGYADAGRQRDLSVRYVWGHDQDFGDFSVRGIMGSRHLSIPAQFADRFGVLPSNLAGSRVLDIGVWTGGTSLLLSALGAEVVAIEEVKKYADTVSFLKKCFALENLTVLNASLYELNNPEFFDGFDFVLFSGVIYHLTDPVLALRIVFNALRDGGRCLLETFAVDRDGSWVNYQGPTAVSGGSREQLNRTGWNWFVPSPQALRQMMADAGFQEVGIGPIENARVLAVGKRTVHCDILRAGLSVRTIR
jgi:SAM-dependent methyltransferase